MNKKYALLSSRMRERPEDSREQRHTRHLINLASEVDTRFADFIAWMRIRRPISKDLGHEAPIQDETLDFILEGVVRFINGTKNPWPKPRGNKANPGLMWQYFWLATMGREARQWLPDVTFPDDTREYLPQHKSDNATNDDLSGYRVVADALNTTPDNVETHVRNANKRLETLEGQIEFLTWIRNNVKHPIGLIPQYFSADHPEAIAYRAKLVDAGVLKPKRKK